LTEAEAGWQVDRMTIQPIDFARRKDGKGDMIGLFAN
jgi:hypothetical protein